MGLFSSNYDKPGPGVPKDMPRKTGIARFFEILFRDLFDLIKLSILFSLCIVPTVAAFIFGASPYIIPFLFAIAPEEIGGTGLFIIPLMISLLLAYPVGGALTACYFNITRFMRDDPSFLWFEFKRKFKENHRQAALPGIFCTAFVYIQVLLWLQVYYEIMGGVFTGGILWLALTLLSIIIFGMIAPYLFMHLAYIDMKTPQILKNSLLMALAYLPRSFMGSVFGGIIWILFIFFFPNSMFIFPLVPLFFAALSMFLLLSWMWKPFEKHFNLEETLKIKKEERMARETDES